MPGFMPGIHVFPTRCKQDVDGDKPGHDGERDAKRAGARVHSTPALRADPPLQGLVIDA
jgi:hypothetical protein